MPIEKWWAREDSNLQPDRYERSALTIELRARGMRQGAAATPCKHGSIRPHTMPGAERQSGRGLELWPPRLDSPCVPASPGTPVGRRTSTAGRSIP
jgi:hypothetical protein